MVPGWKIRFRPFEWVMGNLPRKGNRNMKTQKTNGNHILKRMLALALGLLLAVGTACAETISDIGSYHSGWLSYLCTMPDGRILMGGGETDGTDSISSHAILVCLNTDRSVCWKKTLSAGTADNSIYLGTVLEDRTIEVVKYDKVWNKKVLFLTQDGTFTGKEFAIPEEYTDYAAEPSFLMAYRTRGNDPAETLLLDWNGNVTARYDGMIMKDGIGDLISGKNELILYGNDSQDQYHAKLQKLEGVSDRTVWETVLDFQQANAGMSRLGDAAMTADGGFAALLQENVPGTEPDMFEGRNYLVRFDAEGRAMWTAGLEAQDGLYPSDVFAYNGKIAVRYSSPVDEPNSFPFRWFDEAGKELGMTELTLKAEDFPGLKEAAGKEQNLSQEFSNITLDEVIPMEDGAWLPATMSIFGTNEEQGFHKVNEDVPYIMVRIPEP